MVNHVHRHSKLGELQIKLRTFLQLQRPLLKSLYLVKLAEFPAKVNRFELAAEVTQKRRSSLLNIKDALL